MVGGAATDGRQTGLVAVFTLLSWLGEYVHNLYELPELTVVSPENSLPALVSLMLFVLWWRGPFPRGAAALLLVWTVFHLVGGAVISVIPFGFLPFYPRQSTDHYAAHIVYGLAQLPLIAMMIGQLAQGMSRGKETALS